MFYFTDSVQGDVRVDVAFTDSSHDLRGMTPAAPLEAACEVRFAWLSQVHGAEVVVAEDPTVPGAVPVGDALVTTQRGLGLMVRAADCVPVLLADPRVGVVGAVHSGRPGTAAGAAPAAVAEMRARGAERLRAWIGPHVCGGCYEVPAELRDEVAALVPATYAETSWGTPSLDLGAGVEAQLTEAGVEVTRVPGCTREDPALHSYRRDGAASGRGAGLVWMSTTPRNRSASALRAAGSRFRGDPGKP